MEQKGEGSVQTGLDVDTHLAIMASSAPAVLEMATIAQSIKKARRESLFLFQVHRSVHAGEFGPSDVVFQAIERLGAERIVFGYSVAKSIP